MYIRRCLSQGLLCLAWHFIGEDVFGVRSVTGEVYGVMVYRSGVINDSYFFTAKTHSTLRETNINDLYVFNFLMLGISSLYFPFTFILVPCPLVLVLWVSAVPVNNPKSTVHTLVSPSL